MVQYMLYFCTNNILDSVTLKTLTYVRSLQINVRVTTMDAELEFAILSDATGKQLFEQVSNSQRLLNFFKAKPVRRREESSVLCGF